jgi:anti-sigma factor RsiW
MASHFSHEQLLWHLDGELSKTEARKAKEHLRVCGKCTAELDSLNEHLATIIEAQVEVFGPSLPPPPKPWPQLDPRLDAEAIPNHRSLWEKLVP